MKRKGFIVSLEVIFALVVMFSLMNLTLYAMRSFNVERYISTIHTTTLIQVAKSGGTHNSFTVLNGIGDIIETANAELARFVPGVFNAQISGGPDFVTHGNTTVWVSMTWTYPGFPIILGTPNVASIGREVEFRMQSLIFPGALLGPA